MEIVLSLVLGVIASLVAAPLWELIADTFYRLNALRPFSVDGLWLAEFAPPSPKNSHTIELFYLRQRRDKIRLVIRNYNSSRGNVLTLTGYGIYRSGVLSSIYYFPAGDAKDIGCLILRTLSDERSAQPILTGYYYQYIDRAFHATGNFICAPLTLKRVKTNDQQRSGRFTKQAYGSYAELSAIKDKLV
jgi:hypothetical protein